MKIKFLPILIFAALVILSGCKPKETTLSGQMFIVTQGAENIKLGDVEVLLIEKSEVANFLGNKLSVVESEISSRQKEYETTKGEVQVASANLDSFETDGPLTKPEYHSMKSEYKRLKQEGSQLAYDEDLRNKQFDTEQNTAMEAINAGNFDKVMAHLEKSASAETNLEEILGQMATNAIDAGALKIKLDKIEASANSDKTDLEQKLTEAQLRFNEANAKLNDYPAGESYFADFSPSIIQKKLTDADGKFSFIYPRDKSLSIFATAQRVVLDKTEKYYWLVDAPTNVESVQIFLSNNNLATADPDGYFKLKPRQVLRESVAP